MNEKFDIDIFNEDEDDNKLAKSKNKKKPKKENNHLFLKFLKSLGNCILKIAIFLLNNPLIGGIVLALFISANIIAAFNFHWFGLNTTKVTYEDDATLMEMVNLEDLNAVTDKYTGIVSRTSKKDKNDIKYYASYEGTITAICKTNKINIKLDKENKKINVKLPDIEVTTSVDMSSLKYMFFDSSYDNKDVDLETYKLAEKDLETEVQQDNAIKVLAKDNVKEIIRGLLKDATEESNFKIKFMD